MAASGPDRMPGHEVGHPSTMSIDAKPPPRRDPTAMPEESSGVVLLLTLVLLMGLVTLLFT